METGLGTNSMIWVTGAGGLIGGELMKLAPALCPDGAIVRGLARQDLDLENSLAVQALYRAERPSLIIHCAALSRTPACQKDPPLAWKSNFSVTELLAGLGVATRLIFFSTDLVFDGTKGNYDESATTHPFNVYGETKVAAEKVVLANPRNLVIRTSLNYGHTAAGNRSFNEELLMAWREGRRTPLFVDEFRSPIAAVKTARITWELASRGVAGVVHLAGSERLSRFEIGAMVAAHHGIPPTLLSRMTLAENTGPRRAPDTSLNCSKLVRILGRPLPGFTEWFRKNQSSS
jgi:dTDP-4-dehydrorhamnose reductase